MVFMMDQGKIFFNRAETGKLEYSMDTLDHQYNLHYSLARRQGI